jgi:hypothetical protein
VTFHPCVTIFIMNSEQSPIRHDHPWFGGGSWVGELVGVADVMKGYVRLEKTSHSSMGWWRSMFGECGS